MLYKDHPRSFLCWFWFKAISGTKFGFKILILRNFEKIDQCGWRGEGEREIKEEITKYEWKIFVTIPNFAIAII